MAMILVVAVTTNRYGVTIVSEKAAASLFKRVSRNLRSYGRTSFVLVRNSGRNLLTLWKNLIPSSVCQ